MKKVLIIDSTGRDSMNSKTKLLSEAVIKKMELPKEGVVYLDLYKEELPKIDLEVLNSRKTQKFETLGSKKAKQYLDQFESADEYIFIFPTWNWSVPGILKDYIDLIMISGHNFTYKGFKIVGLLENKKATIINTTGGPVLPRVLASIFKVQTGVNYMNTILKILGIKDIKKIVISGTSYRFKNPKKELNFDIELYEKEVKKIISKI